MDAEHRLSLASEISRNLLPADRDSAAWQIASGALSIANNNPRQAEHMFRKSLQNRPHNAQAQFLLAQSLYHQGRRPQAELLARDLRSNIPESHEIRAFAALTAPPVDISSADPPAAAQ